MDFGFVPSSEINGIDFTLPKDGIQTSQVLGNKDGDRVPIFHVGCSRWENEGWINLLYPQDINKKKLSAFYVEKFNSVELATTFYLIPTQSSILQSMSVFQKSLSPDFRFYPKISRTISHIHRLKGASKETVAFLDGIKPLQSYIDACFLQLSDNFKVKSANILEEYLRAFPTDSKLFVEVREKEWFAQENFRSWYFGLLKELKMGAIITDASGRRDAVHMELTIPELFVRFVGNGGSHFESDFRRIDSWVERIKIWLDKGLEKVIFFLHQRGNEEAPILAQYAIQQFNKHLGASLAELDLLVDVETYVADKALVK